MVIRALFLFGILFSLSACKIADLFLGGEPVTRIFFESKGGFPPANQPAPHETLELLRDNNGAIIAHYKTNYGCDVRNKIPAADFDDLSDLILKSAVRIGTTQLLDGGTSTVQIERKNFAQRYHLDDDGSSYGQEILVDGQFIAQKIQKILAGLQCQPTSQPLAVVEYHRPVFLSPGGAQPAFYEEVHLSVDFVSYAGYHAITGSIGVHSNVGAPSCVTNFSKQRLDVDLSREAGMISIACPQVLCAMEAIGPTPYMLLIDVKGDRQHGYFGCWAPEQMQNHEPYLKKLDLWLQKHDRCSGNPLGVR